MFAKSKFQYSSIHIEVRMKMKEAEAGIVYSIQEEAAGWCHQGARDMKMKGMQASIIHRHTTMKRGFDITK